MTLHIVVTLLHIVLTPLHIVLTLFRWRKLLFTVLRRPVNGACCNSRGVRPLT
ncbi:hypothetical protein CHS0354_005789, partial [Potamilus streckersoni]